MKEWLVGDISKKSVGVCLYPDNVICCLLLKMSYHLCLRQATGFVESLLPLLGKGSYAIPDYSTLCCRHEVLCRLAKGENLDVAVGSTGLKVYGEGKWKVRKHRCSKRRTWCKLHVGIDENTQQIIVAELTGHDKDDVATAKTIWKFSRKKVVNTHFYQTKKLFRQAVVLLL